MISFWSVLCRYLIHCPKAELLGSFLASIFNDSTNLREDSTTFEPDSTSLKVDSTSFRLDSTSLEADSTSFGEDSTALEVDSTSI
jgi:hypothetical protein